MTDLIRMLVSFQTVAQYDQFNKNAITQYQAFFCEPPECVPLRTVIVAFIGISNSAVDQQSSSSVLDLY